MNKIKNGSTTGRGNCFTFSFVYKTHLLNKSDNFPLGVEVFPEDSEYSDPLTLLVYTKRLCKILGRISDLTYTSTLRENCPRVFLVRFFPHSD